MAKVLPSPASDTLRFDYFIEDHLGNVRVVFDEKGNTSLQTGYYAFGLSIDRSNPAQTPAARNAINRYNFLGKETQVATGYIDLQARFYDPTVGRFMQVDPVTELQENRSVYQYGWNNPILRSDPNGTYPDGPGDDPFLIARLVTTAFYDTKHALYNTAFRFSGAPLRAGYAEENGHQVFDTNFSSLTTDKSVAGQVKEAVNAVADVALVASAGGSSPENPGSLLSKTSVESQVVKTVKEDTSTRAGMPFTRKGRTEVLDANAAKNQGKIVCEGCGVNTTKPEKSTKEITPPKTDYQVDHVVPKVKADQVLRKMGKFYVEIVTLKKAIIKMEYKKILFEHENAAEGGYGIESAWAIPEGDNFKLTNILFYAPEYSWGDIVSVENRDGELFVTGLIEESGHSTVRIIFYNSDDVRKTIEYLKNIGCDAEISNIPTFNFSRYPCRD